MVDGTDSTQPLPDGRRPEFSFRIGVTGASTLPPKDGAEFAHIRTQVDTALMRIYAQLVALWNSARVKQSYELSVPPILRCVSPLGEGADRLFAKSVLNLAKNKTDVLGVCLEVILPFDRSAYETTFSPNDEAGRAASIMEFEHLLAEAECGVFELDGERTSDIVRPQSYEAMGRVVVRNSDLMIAVWDPESAAKGRGGARDTIHYALQAGVPVWLINPNGLNEPIFLSDPLDLFGKIPDAEGAEADRDAYLTQTIVPPPPQLGKADALQRYFNEPKKMCHNIWHIHPNFLRWVKTGKFGNFRSFPWRRAEFSSSRSIAAVLSGAYQNCYRSSYFLIFIFAAIALISAVTGFGLKEIEAGTTVAECFSLIMIVVLLVFNNQRLWHERYISYRLIAELNRPTAYLHALGWGLPFGRMRRAAGGEAESWVAWLAAAHNRSAPMPTGAIKSDLEALRRKIVVTLLSSQISFHEKRHQENHRAAKRFDGWGRNLFIATVMIVALKAPLLFPTFETFCDQCFGAAGGMKREWIVDLLAWFASILPAFAAAAFGLKAYEEFEQLSVVSQQMHDDLTRARDRISSIDLTRPLASQMLAAELFDAASIMLSEVGGWAQLFRMKAVEA